MSYIFKKTSALSIICGKYKNEDEKIFKEGSINISKIIGFIEDIELLYQYD